MTDEDKIWVMALKGFFWLLIVFMLLCTLHSCKKLDVDAKAELPKTVLCRDECYKFLAVTSSQGSCYEDCIDEIKEREVIV